MSALAAATRPRAVPAQTSVVAPSAATAAALAMTNLVRRLSASMAIADTHNRVYHHGNRPGAIQTIGASTAASVATPGANHGDIPRRAPSVVAPAAAPASSTETAARNSGISQINHRDASTPCWGM